MSNTNCDEILLGIGHGFLNFAELIVIDIKDLRLNHYAKLGIDIPKIHLVDHDIEDSEGNFTFLGNNEYVIYLFGEEKVRRFCDPEKHGEIIDAMRIMIEENRGKFTVTK